MDSGKAYHRQCTGDALVTVQAHQGPADITLFGSCFCPFVQRVWVALEYLQIPYRYYEVDPYAKPAELLEVSPKGLVPAIKLHNFEPPRALNESTVIMDYLEDLASNTTKRSLLPSISDPYHRALIRLQSDVVNRQVVPAFYRYLQAQEPQTQIEKGTEFSATLEQLTALLERTSREVDNQYGLWSENGQIGWTDIMIGPWLLRVTNVLKHYRGFELPPGEKLTAWINRLLQHPAFKSTCSTESLYLESYERYAFNRPNTSQVATAINSGRPLP